jgi:medium-chain acyl-[acyl-carrier-protein] hydrolase
MMTSESIPTNEWIDRVLLVKNPSIRLFCFPFAGGSSQAYYGWNGKLPGDIELCPILLPGRGARFSTPAYRQIDQLIPALADAIIPALDRPFAFFGHSMGGIIAFELAQHLRRLGRASLLNHLYVSGCRAPHVPHRSAPIFDLPDTEFLNELRKLNGVPEEVFEDRSLLDLLIPLLRADFELIETYEHKSNPPLPCQITAIAGLSDLEVTRDDVRAWRECTSIDDFSMHFLPGDHFFIRQSENLVLQIVLRRLYSSTLFNRTALGT